MPKINPLMLIPPLLFVALAATFWVGMRRDNPDALPSALQGRSAPAVALTPLEQMPLFDDAALRDGSVKLVNFWASWCAPCRAEHPNLTALRDLGITVYGVNYKDEAPKALNFLRELGNPYAAGGADPQGRMGLNWGLYGVPETYVIGPDGTILLRHAGPITERVIESDILPAIDRATR